MRDDILVAITNLLNGYVARYAQLPFAAANVWLFYDVLSGTYIQYALKASRELNLDSISAKSIPRVLVSDNGNEQITYKTGGLADIYLTIDLELLVSKATHQSAALNLLDLAVKQAIASNPTLNGLVAHTTIMPQTGGVTTGSDNIAKRTRQIRVLYEATVTGGL